MKLKSVQEKRSTKLYSLLNSNNFHTTALVGSILSQTINSKVSLLGLLFPQHTSSQQVTNSILSSKDA